MSQDNQGDSNTVFAVALFMVFWIGVSMGVTLERKTRDTVARYSKTPLENPDGGSRRGEVR